MAKKINSNVDIIIPNVRLSFEHIFTPVRFAGRQGREEGEPRYTAQLMIPKSEKKIVDKVWDAIDECLFKMWGDNPPKIRDDRYPFHDGDMDYDKEKYPDYEGHMILAASKQAKQGAPTVVHSIRGPEVGSNGKKKFLRLTGSEGVIYSGCFVNFTGRLWAMDADKGFGDRVNCSLEAVQFFADGEPFGGAARVDPEETFDGMEGEVDAVDPREDRDDRRSSRRGDSDSQRSDEGSRRGQQREEPARSASRSSDVRAERSRDGARQPAGGGRDRSADRKTGRDLI
jgi:hypothetical protein